MLKFRHPDVKLDFKDVLVVPRKTTISSRSMVSLTKKFYFKTTPTTIWEGTPIISSNMDTVTNLETFRELKEHKYISCFPKHLNEEWIENTPFELQHTDNYMLSCGVNDEDVENLIKLVDKLKKDKIVVKFICVDVANGYMSKLLDVCMELRKRYPDKVIIAGNVVTPERVAELITKGGVNIVKCGIGCFTEDTKVLMANGSYRNINKIKVGEYVINGNGSPVKVLNVIFKGTKDIIRLKTNTWPTCTKVTPEHRYLALNIHGTKSIKWEHVSGCQQGFHNMLLPKQFKWTLPNSYSVSLQKRSIKSNYQLAYFIGIYLRYGYEQSIDSLTLHIPIHHGDVLLKVMDIVRNIFKIKTDYYRDQLLDTFEITLYDKQFASFIRNCVHSIDMNTYICTNKSFIKGLYDSLYTINSTLTSQMTDLYLWCCINLKKTYEGEVLSSAFGYQQVNILDNKVIGNESGDVWDIEVDCPSHSFIANNCIVHNSGSVCDTRLKTGIGYPQLSTVLECAEVAKRVGGHVMSDGGIIYPGDIVKAFVAGASFVMLGSMLAGCSESPGEMILNPRDNKWYKAFYGMSSKKALEKYNGGFKNYRTSEGKERHILHKGPLKNVVNDINGGLRSACSYLDCYSIEDLEHNGEFVRVTQHHNTYYE